MNEKILTDKEKIDAILEKFQINLAEFSRNLDVKLDTIYSVFYEKTKGFSVEILKKIIKTYPEISPYWLITGEGSMLAADNSSILINQHDNNTATIAQSANLDKLIELSTSQQQTIAQLVSMLNNNQFKIKTL